MFELLFLNRFIIHVCAIGAVQVPDRYVIHFRKILVGLERNHGVAATDSAFIQLKVITMVAADGEITRGQFDFRNNGAMNDVL